MIAVAHVHLDDVSAMSRVFNRRLPGGRPGRRRSGHCQQQRGDGPLHDAIPAGVSAQAHAWR
jgi:hypothetical protein